MDKHIEHIQKQVQDRSADFCLDNPEFLGKQLQVETLMLIGVSIALGTPVDLTDDHKLSDTPEGQELLTKLFTVAS